MLRKILVVVLIAAAVVFGLWRWGVLDERRLKHKATELQESAEKNAKRIGEEAAKSARDAVDDTRR
jgi:hypothetical protein